jgi:glucosamine-6-phosphate deaminase
MSSFSSRTRVVTLTKTTYEQNSPLFKKPEDMPMRAMTMGVGTCLDAKRLLLLATHKEKANIVAAALEGPVTNMISATALQLHDNAVVVLDADAASKLKYRDEYAFQFANDPKWAAYQPAKRKASRAKAKAKK